MARSHEKASPTGHRRSRNPARPKSKGVEKKVNANRKELKKHFKQLMKSNKLGIIDFPLRYVPESKLDQYLKPLLELFDGAVSAEELRKAADMAQISHILDVSRNVDLPFSKDENTRILDQLEIQRSPNFFREPRDLLLTLCACSLASFTQGWDQAATGNLGWPREFGLDVDVHNSKRGDVFIFGGISGVMWFSAAILGSYVSDPISERVGRRGALIFAALCSLSSVIAASQTTSWQGLLVTRVTLGLGIGGKASVVPILESEVASSPKRGRLLCGWQLFVALGIFAGHVASWITRDDWRKQLLSAAIPAFALLLMTLAACESHRWLILQDKHAKALETLTRLRKQRMLALKEQVTIYYQIQVERWVFSRQEVANPDNPFERVKRQKGFKGWMDRSLNNFTFPRIQRATIAGTVVMLCQTFSGINVVAFFATSLFSTASLRSSSERDAQLDSYRLAMAFGAVNAIASAIPFFLVDDRTEKVDKERSTENRSSHGANVLDEHESFSTKNFEKEGLPKESSGEHGAVDDSVKDGVEREDGERRGDEEDGLGENGTGIPEDAKEVNSRKDLSTQQAPGQKLLAAQLDVQPHAEGHQEPDPSKIGTDALTPTTAQAGSTHMCESSKTQELTEDVATRSTKDELAEHHSRPVSSSASARSRIPPPLSDETCDTEDSDTEEDNEADGEPEDEDLYETDIPFQWRGRRFLLLTSLFLCMVFLFITALCFQISVDSPARLPAISCFILAFTFSYSIGAGAIPWLYCAEIFPNEGRESGMSFCTFVNFMGAGILSTFVPFGINWGQDGGTYGHGKLLGLFSGLNGVAFILVWFLVPSTNQTTSLEDMNYVFGRRLKHHIKVQWKRLPFTGSIRQTQGVEARGSKIPFFKGFMPRGNITGLKLKFASGADCDPAAQTAVVDEKQSQIVHEEESTREPAKFMADQTVKAGADGVVEKLSNEDEAGETAGPDPSTAKKKRDNDEITNLPPKKPSS